MNAFRLILCLLFLLGLTRFTSLTPACEFCEGARTTPLVEQFDDAKIVLYGHCVNPKLTPNDLSQGVSDFVIERVYKDHPLIKGKKSLVVRQYVTDPKIKFIVFADVYKGKVDPYKGMQLSDGGEMVRYIEASTK